MEKRSEIRAYSVFGMPSALFSTPVSQLIAQLAGSCASELGMPQLNHSVNPILYHPSVQCSQNRSLCNVFIIPVVRRNQVE